MNKKYIVLEIDYVRDRDGYCIPSNKTIVGIFNKKEMAEKMVKWLYKINDIKERDFEEPFEIEEFDSDTLKSAKERYLKENDWLLED